VILSSPELTIERCNTVNPAERMVLPNDGTPHCCTEESEKFLKARADLEPEPLEESQRVFFVDGSCYRTLEGNRAGYAVVEHDPKTQEYKTIAQAQVPQPCSAQLAEIKALTAACRLAADKTCTVYTDSAYAYGVCHVFGPIWAQRGFQRADGSTITHGSAITDLLRAIQLPKKLAIVKCRAHKTDGTVATRGNTAADEAAKKAAVGEQSVMAVLIPGETEERSENLTLEEIVQGQEAASPEERECWKKRGAWQEDDTKVWRSADGIWVATRALLPMLIKEVHGPDHCNRKVIIDTIRKEWWSPYLAGMVDHFLRQCEVCARNNVRKNFTAPISHIPVPMGPFRHLVMDFVDMQDRVSGKRYILVVVDRFSRWVEAVATADNKAKTVIKFLCVKHKLGCVYHPQSQGMVERANGTIKAKVAKICASIKLNWVQALPRALMKMRSQTNRTLHLTPHEIVTGRPMPMPFTRGPYKGPELEQLEKEMSSYVKHLTEIHRTVYPQVCAATKASEGPTDKEAKKRAKVVPGDFVYIKTFKKKHWKTP
ncbi:hypothetical protein C0J50_22731, partial [Silurus asotus]